MTTDNKLTVKLPDGETFGVHALDERLSNLIEIARACLKDDKITAENFGVGKHFFFVNRSTGTLIGDEVPVSSPLEKLKMKFGQVIELVLA